jgi:hypothetical protein
MAVEMREIGALAPYPRNPRTHSKEQIQQIADSIREFGWTNPVLVDGKGGIIAGHGRVEAAKLLGQAEVPVIELSRLSAAQKRAYIIADNQLALNAGWDRELLRLELGELRGLDFDLALTGLPEFEIADILADRTEGLTDPDEVPDAPKESVTRSGDLWLLGRHRLLCGDCTIVDNQKLITGGQHVGLVFTSPPYGVNLKYSTHNDTFDACVSLIDALALICASSIESGGFAVVNFGDIIAGRVAAKLSEPCEYPMALEYWPRFRSAGFVLWSRRVWVKYLAPGLVGPWTASTNRAAGNWEHIWTWKKSGKARIGHSHRSQWGVIDYRSFEGENSEIDRHPGYFPSWLAEYIVGSHSMPGDTVMDPMIGSGSTMIACERSGRDCVGIEISEAYTDVAVMRWQNFTGQEAVLAGSLITFAEAAASRMPAAA